MKYAGIKYGIAMVIFASGLYILWSSATPENFWIFLLGGALTGLGLEGIIDIKMEKFNK